MSFDQDDEWDEEVRRLEAENRRLRAAQRSNFTECVERVYQQACNDFVNKRRAGQDGEVHFKAANAIEAAWPEIIRAYEDRLKHYGAGR